MKKIVLTGGPSVGKSTVVEILSFRGYQVVPEAARMVIEEESVKRTDTVPWENLQKFQERVLEKQLELESAAVGEIVFLDRGIIDGIAYCEIGKVSTPKEIFELGKGRYDKIFLLESVGVYTRDGVRSRGVEDQQALHIAIEEAYKSFGYELTKVPPLPPEERADFILANL